MPDKKPKPELIVGVAPLKSSNDDWLGFALETKSGKTYYATKLEGLERLMIALSDIRSAALNRRKPDPTKPTPIPRGRKLNNYTTGLDVHGQGVWLTLYVEGEPAHTYLLSGRPLEDIADDLKVASDQLKQAPASKPS